MCFVTQVQTRLPKTKRVWPMKINVICTVHVYIYIYVIRNIICSIEGATEDSFTVIIRA